LFVQNESHFIAVVEIDGTHFKSIISVICNYIFDYENVRCYYWDYICKNESFLVEINVSFQLQRFLVAAFSVGCQISSKLISSNQLLICQNHKNWNSNVSKKGSETLFFPIDKI
jgi:hypothetical protein